MYLNGEEYPIKMDCHVSILHFLDDKKEHMAKLIKRSELQIFDGVPIRVLDLHDRLLHMITHFTKENFRCDMRWYLTGERQQRRDYRIRLPLLHEIAIIINKNKKSFCLETLIQRAEELGCQDEVKMVFMLLEKVYINLLDDFHCEVDTMKPFFLEKYRGMFYPLELLFNKKIDVLENRFSEKAEAIMQSVVHEKALVLNKQYNVVRDRTNEMVDRCLITEETEESIGNIVLSLNDDSFIIKLKGEQFIGIERLYLTFGSSYKSNILSAYINKFSLDISQVRKRSYRDCEIHNGYVDLRLKGNILIDTSEHTISVTFPRDFLIISHKQKSLLIDIGIPSLFSEGSKKMKLYDINDIGARGLGDTFYFSPKLLQTVCL